MNDTGVGGSDETLDTDFEDFPTLLWHINFSVMFTVGTCNMQLWN